MQLTRLKLRYQIQSLIDTSHGEPFKLWCLPCVLVRPLMRIYSEYDTHFLILDIFSGVHPLHTVASTLHPAAAWISWGAG